MGTQKREDTMEIIKEILSPSKLYKAEIMKRDDNLLQVDVYMWDEEWETWLQVSRDFSQTNSIKISIEIAVEKLRNCSGENIEIS
jgi:hypothetical protein